jgi:hypothetical protein
MAASTDRFAASPRLLAGFFAALLVACSGSSQPDDAGTDGPDAAAPDGGGALDGGGADAGPPGVCGGPEGASCGPDAWCDYGPGGACGEDGFPGLCQPRPTACGELYFPVCGCDGTTYDNPCRAHAAGVAVRYDGECDPGALCGVAGVSCEEDEWCDTPDGARCATEVSGGECRPRPDVCPTIWAPVCGCDGTTYANECDAHASGVEVAYDGECSSRRVCGGRGGFACLPGEYCDFPDAAACGVGDVRGFCEPVPLACPTGGDDPVCGCDGVTYASACAAAAAGVDVATPGACVEADPCAAQDARAVGECATPLGVFWDGAACRSLSGCECDGTACGEAFDSIEACEATYAGCMAEEPCTGDADCGDGEWCDFPVGALCGADDTPGVCRPRPDSCVAVYRSVCGCDGASYGNACEAASAGTDVAYLGACDSGDRCAPQDATGVGPCRAVLGWFWDGEACGAVSGCECRGTACGFGWSSEEACEAAHLGCDAGGDACSPSAPCPEGEYCDYEAGSCGETSGVCREQPEICAPVYALVCGCDGTTYVNACEAAAAGEDVRYPGACAFLP